MRTIEEVVELVCSYLNDRGIPYVIVGGVAIPFWGAPRTTVDIDLMLQIPEEKIRVFIKFLERKGFFASEEDLKTALKEKSHCTIEDKLSPYRLDVKGIYTKFDEETLRRRVEVDYLGVKMYINPPENAIASKLKFGSDRDLVDAESIYVRQLEKLDVPYLEEKCKELGVYRDYLRMKEKIAKYLKDLKKRRGR